MPGIIVLLISIIIFASQGQTMGIWNYILTWLGIISLTIGIGGFILLEVINFLLWDMRMSKNDELKRLLKDYQESYSIFENDTSTENYNRYQFKLQLLFEYYQKIHTLPNYEISELPPLV